MCCLFGMIDYGNVLSKRQRERVIKCLATESMVRGRDATGIAYLHGGSLNIFKKPLPANKMYFHLPADANTVMGHTRLTTQGSEKSNYNNHPFLGRCGRHSFALAHNGVLHNDVALRKSEHLPSTYIQTDSYVAVQLLEKSKNLDLPAIRYMAEAVKGSFSFSVLDDTGSMYLIKGDSPLTLLRFKAGFYLYASTDEILSKTIIRAGLWGEPYEKVHISEGEIVCIEQDGELLRDEFDFRYPRYGCYDYYSYYFEDKCEVDDAYVAELKDIASSFGFSPEEVDILLADGFTPEDIEEIFYSECAIYDRL